MQHVIPLTLSEITHAIMSLGFRSVFGNFTQPSIAHWLIHNATLLLLVETLIVCVLGALFWDVLAHHASVVSPDALIQLETSDRMRGVLVEEERQFGQTGSKSDSHSIRNTLITSHRNMIPTPQHSTYKCNCRPTICCRTASNWILRNYHKSLPTDRMEN